MLCWSRWSQSDWRWRTGSGPHPRTWRCADGGQLCTPWFLCRLWRWSRQNFPRGHEAVAPGLSAMWRSWVSCCCLPPYTLNARLSLTHQLWVWGEPWSEVWAGRLWRKNMHKCTVEINMRTKIICYTDLQNSSVYALNSKIYSVVKSERPWSNGYMQMFITSVSQSKEILTFWSKYVFLCPFECILKYWLLTKIVRFLVRAWVSPLLVNTQAIFLTITPIFPWMSNRVRSYSPVETGPNPSLTHLIQVIKSIRTGLYNITEHVMMPTTNEALCRSLEDAGALQALGVCTHGMDARL